MIDLLTPRAIRLTPGNRVLETPRVPLAQLTSGLTVRLQRPTTLVPLAWGVDDLLKVSLVYVVDGVEYRCDGQCSGGIRTNERGEDVGVYAIRYGLPVLFGDKAREYLLTAQKDVDGCYTNVPLTRVGELGSTIEGYLRLERLSGSIETVLSLAMSEEAPAPLFPRHKNSVAFDAVSTVEETSGDGVVSVTHTASGSNRAAAAIVGTFQTNDNAPSSGTTYNGVSMTEHWDTKIVGVAHDGNSGYTLAGIPTGAQTVTNTLVSATPNDHYLVVVSVTGVDQTTPVGTASSGTGNTTSSTRSVSGVGTDDLVIDGISIHNGASSITIGADQTSRASAQLGFSGVNVRVSTQPGSAGGDMSWSWTTSEPFVHGAIAFKAAAGGAFSLTADAGSYVVSGTVASLLFARRLVADAGSYTLTGTAASLFLNRLLSAAAGSYAITGTDATLIYSGTDRVLAAGAGAYSITTGTQAALLYNRLLASDAGAYVVNGTNANLTYSAALTAAGDFIIILRRRRRYD